MYSVAVSTRDFDNSKILESVSFDLQPSQSSNHLTPLSGFEPQYDLNHDILFVPLVEHGESLPFLARRTDTAFTFVPPLQTKPPSGVFGFS